MQQLTTKVPDIDRATVYRVIKLFEKLNVVQRLHTGWKYKLELSDTFAEHHHHMTCTHCNKTIAMNERELEQLVDRLAKQHAFTPTTHQIEIQGICKDCASS